jgi:prolyl oligopeptidase
MFAILFFGLWAGKIIAQESRDPYLWLEDIDGKKALQWVNAKNTATTENLKKQPGFQEMNKKILDILNSKQRIPYPSVIGKSVYNFWQDEKNERGLWRRTSLASYFKDSTAWESVLDIDALCKAENEKWVWSGISLLEPSSDLCLVWLSRGGGDAVVIREFDLVTKKFVKNGFFLPESKGSASWIDRNTLLVGTDFGKGTMTESGYPRITKIWKRGTPLDSAKTLYEGKTSDMGCWGFVIDTPQRQYWGVTRGITFYTSETYVEENGKLVKLDIPEDADFGGFFKNQLLVRLKSDWTVKGNTYAQGALIGIDYRLFLKGNRKFTVIYQPDEKSNIDSYSTTKNHLLVAMISNVCSGLHKYGLVRGQWRQEKVAAPDLGTISIYGGCNRSDRYFFTYENFLNPRTLYFVGGRRAQPKPVKRLPEFFDGSRCEVKQYEAVSKDGTRIPYFAVLPKTMKEGGTCSTLLYGYGGFESSQLPKYNSVVGSSWLEKGGAYVLANIRGGGEFGPRWHQAGLKKNRQKVFDDFLAVSEDLIRRKITSPSHLGIEGGSNGGLLVGAVFTQRPDLYNAVVCEVPLLDMRRYNKLLAGASWMAEFGNPDIPEEWAYIKKYSPYHHVSKSKKYPQVLFLTSTRDDRVHPGHARKMAAKMADQGHKFFYYENTEGGHGASVTNEQKAFMHSLTYAYLWKMLK